MEETENNESEDVTITAKSILSDKGLLDVNSIIQSPEDNTDLEKWHKDLAEEQKKWDALEELHRVPQQEKIEDDITYEEAIEYFKQQGEKEIDLTANRQIFSVVQLFQCLFGTKPLAKSLQIEKDLVFYMAKVTMENDNEVHCRVLDTIYKNLTGSKVKQPRFGPHWEDIGFQGNDPATDLRGSGFLGLLQLLVLVTKYRDIALEMYKLSTHSTYNFPFCVMSINITRIALQALRGNKLTRICNQTKQVIEVCNEFYVATFWRLYTIWKQEHKTILDSGPLLNHIEKYALKNPLVLLKILRQAAKQQRSENQVEKPVVFSRISTASTNSDTQLEAIQTKSPSPINAKRTRSYEKGLEYKVIEK